jgi:O-antigen ligase
MAALFILCGWLLWREQRLPAVAVAAVFALGVAALVLTDVRSSVASLGLAFFAVGRIRTPSLTAFGGLLIAGLIVIVAVPDVLERIAPHFSRGGNAEQALTLTGRTDIWAQSLSLFEQRPVLGYGYASTRILFPEEFVTLNAKALPPPHAHNVIIQSLVAMGIIGTLLLLVPLLSQVVYAVRHRDAPINAFICYSLIMSLTSLGSIGTAPNALSVFWIVTILLTSNAAAPCVARAMAGGAARRIQEAGSPSRRQQSLARRRGWQDDRSAPQSPP